RRIHPDRYGDKTRIPGSTHERAIAMVRKLSPQRLVDIGAGEGYVAEACHRLRIAVTAIDAVPPRNSAVPFLPCDLDRDPVPVGAPFGLVLPGRWGRVFGAIASALAYVWRRGFAFQFLVQANVQPGVRQLLGQSRQIHSSPTDQQAA